MDLKLSTLRLEVKQIQGRNPRLTQRAPSPPGHPHSPNPSSGPLKRGVSQGSGTYDFKWVF